MKRIETIDQARANLAIAGTGKTTSAYAKAHGLPYLALAKLLSSGSAGDDSSYAPIYDHALTLSCEQVEEQDNKSKAAG